jgi:hypothetical protein
LPNTFNEGKGLLAFLLAYRIAEDSPQDADVTAKLCISNVVGWLMSHGFRRLRPQHEARP